MRINPQVLDIFGFKTLDGVFCSHQHSDHTDIYTLKAATQTSGCPIFGPLSSVERMRQFNDRIATMTGAPGRPATPGVRRPFEDVAVTFFFKIASVNLCHLADTLY